MKACTVSKSRIIETTQFWNESLYFAERVENTLSYADLLLIAESELSFSGKVSRLYVVPGLIEQLPKESRERVIFVPVDLSSMTAATNREREAVVRQAGFEHLKKHGLLEMDDILMVQDFDEFFDPKCAQELRDYFASSRRDYVHPRYRCTYYYLNWAIVSPRAHADWIPQVAFRARHALMTEGFWIHDYRTKRPLSRRWRVPKPYWGWHHSYLGGRDAIESKIKAFSGSASSMIRATTPETRSERLREGEDLYGRRIKFAEFESYDTFGILSLLKRQDLMVPTT